VAKSNLGRTRSVDFVMLAETDYALQRARCSCPGITDNRFMNVLIGMGAVVRQLAVAAPKGTRVSISGERSFDWPYNWKQEMPRGFKSKERRCLLLPDTIAYLRDCAPAYPDEATMLNHLMQVGAVCLRAAGQRQVVRVTVGNTSTHMQLIV